MDFLILAAALLVDLACRYVPAHLPFFFPFIFNAPVFLGCAYALFWYGRGLQHADAEQKPGWLRRVFFHAGILLIWFVLQTHFEYWSQHMFFLNRIQAVSLGMVAPFCLAIAWPGNILVRGAPGWIVGLVRHPAVQKIRRVLMHPLLSMVLFLVTTDLWLIPGIHFAAMLDPLLYAVMNLSCLLGGLLFWFVVLDPRPKAPSGSRLSFLTRAAFGFLIMFPQIGISAYIALTPHILYDFYNLCGRLFPSISPGYDQMLGGMIQWIPPGMMNTAALLLSLNALRLADLAAEKDFAPPPGAKIYEAKWTGRS